MTATTTNNVNTTSTKAEYFNLNIKGLGHLSNTRRIETLNGGFLSVVINTLSGPTDSPTYVRFDATVAGKEATDLYKPLLESRRRGPESSAWVYSQQPDV